MAAQLPESHKDLLEKPAFANLATLMPDGSPQVSPVWCDRDGEFIRVNTARGRVKDRNMTRDSRVALAISDPVNPYRYLGVRGRVVEITEKGADVSIDALSKKYLGKDKYPFSKPGEVRVIYKIKPEHFHAMG